MAAVSAEFRAKARPESPAAAVTTATVAMSRRLVIVIIGASPLADGHGTARRAAIVHQDRSEVPGFLVRREPLSAGGDDPPTRIGISDHDGERVVPDRILRPVPSRGCLGPRYRHHAKRGDGLIAGRQA